MNIFIHKSTKTLLKAYISHLPKAGYGEISRIAEHLRVSITLVSQIISGSKVLTPEQAEKLTEYLQLTPLERKHFIFLVQMERAGTPELREFWSARLKESRSSSLALASRVNTDHPLTDTERAVFYSTALHSAIRMYNSIGENGKTIEEICARFRISRLKASAILEFLVQAGLSKNINGRYYSGIQKTHLELGSPFLPRHHANWRMRAVRKSEDLTPEELMYTAPVSLSKEDFAILREEMVQFIQAFLNRVHASPAEDIACFNIDFFWIDN